MHLSYIGKYITILANDHFGIAYMGFGFFCNILFQDTFSDKDILDLSSSVKHTDFDNMTQNEDKILAKKFNDKSISGTNSHLPEGINIMSFLTTIDSKPLSLMNSYHTLEEPIQEIVSECLKYLTGIPSITIKLGLSDT